MKKILLSAFAFAAMTSVAMAGPVQMTDAQMDAITAGAKQENFAAIGQSQFAVAGGNVTQVQVAVINQSNVKVDGHKKHKKFDHKRPPKHKKDRHKRK